MGFSIETFIARRTSYGERSWRRASPKMSRLSNIASVFDEQIVICQYLFFPRASERRVLPIVGVCKTSSHLHIFSSSHLLIFTIFSSSHLLIFSSSIFSSSHLLIFTSSHLHIFSSSHLLIFTSSHLHIFSSSHLLIFSSSHLLISSSSHLHIFSSSHLLIFTYLLTSSHISHIFSHLLTSSHIFSHLLTSSHIFSHLLTSSHIFSHLLTFTSSLAHLTCSSCPLALLPSCPLALSFFSISFFEGGSRGSGNETARKRNPFARK